MNHPIAGQSDINGFSWKVLEKSNKLLEESQAIAHIGGWEFDAQSKRFTWTPEVYRIHGVGSDYDPNCLENNIAFYDPSSAPVIAEAFKRAVEEGRPYDLELRLIRADGNSIWVRTIGRAIIESGIVARVTGNIMDITERKNAQLEFARLNAELEIRVQERTARLEAANKELETFAFNIAHDLKAPLRAISGFSNIVVEDYQSVLDEEGRRKLKIIAVNAARLDALISSIITITRIGATELRISPISMREMALAMYHETVSAKEIPDIVFTLQPIPDCRGDSTLLRKVWGHLFSNAIKFTAGQPRRIIEVFAEVFEHETKYNVRDNGIGFDMDHACKLFNLFKRLHNSPQYEGTGAGLAIVRRIVELHGGRVGAGNSPDTGTVFWFTLPKRNDG